MGDAFICLTPPSEPLVAQVRCSVFWEERPVWQPAVEDSRQLLNNGGETGYDLVGRDGRRMLCYEAGDPFWQGI